MVVRRAMGPVLAALAVLYISQAPADMTDDVCRGVTE
jgi:hypothetical protein